MGGLLGSASTSDCVEKLFYGTDYHCHLGTRRGGLAVSDGKGIDRTIHDITSSQVRSKFAPDLSRLKGSLGIGAISDYEDQPLMVPDCGADQLPPASVISFFAALTQARPARLA